MKRVKFLLGLVAGALLAITCAAQPIGGPAYTVFSYTGANYFSQYGTNDANNAVNAYTNALVPFKTLNGTAVGLELKFSGYSASASSAVVVNAYRSFDGVTPESTAPWFRWSCATSSYHQVVIDTNFTMVAPWVLLQLENINVVPLTNVTLKAYNTR